MDFYNFCNVVSRKKYFIYTWQKFPPHLNNVLTLPSENENITFHTFVMHSLNITHCIKHGVKHKVHQVQVWPGYKENGPPRLPLGIDGKLSSKHVLPHLEAPRNSIFTVPANFPTNWYYKVCLKCPPLARTQARKRICYWLTAWSISDCFKPRHTCSRRGRSSSISWTLVSYTRCWMTDTCLSCDRTHQTSIWWIMPSGLSFSLMQKCSV